MKVPHQDVCLRISRTAHNWEPDGTAQTSQAHACVQITYALINV